MSDIINIFNDEYSFLSNFYRCEFIILSTHNPLCVPYRSVEHYYQACKAATSKDHMKIVAASGPGKAKRLGRKVRMRENWDKIKVEVMMRGLNAKFSNKELKAKLLNTGNKMLIEGNHWRDTYWGVDLKTGEGQNVLGNLLMNLRQIYKDNGKKDELSFVSKM